jgi:hypothetical protein
MQLKYPDSVYSHKGGAKYPPPTSGFGIVLGKAMLWLVFSSVANSFTSMNYIEQVKSDLVETGIVVPEGRNPIFKIPVLFSGNQGAVYIDELPLRASPPVTLFYKNGLIA